MTQIATEPILGPEQQPTEIGGAPSGKVTGRSPWQLFWRRFRRDRFALAGIGFIILMGVIALAAGLIAQLEGSGPNEVFVREALDEVGLPIGPGGGFLFGADTAGRDLFVRVIYGARTSLTVALFATGLEVVIGTTLGLLAGFYRGKVDTFVSRLIDIVLSLPILLLALGLVAACSLSREGCLGGLIRPGILLVSYVIALFGWPYIARIVRGQVLSLREKEFVEAARAQGSGDLRIMLRDILPNVSAPIIVYTTLIIPANILFEAALSFLGIGVPPDVPSWGKMLSEAGSGSLFTVAWWMLVFPGVFLFLTTLAFNLVGDGLRDALDPRTAR
ncbi:MAG: ABC transporter permease [Actinomycetota bacterium]|nr:ABC transporter permease [Actinomycetota bacterium]